MKTPETGRLLRNPPAFMLLSLIALRCKYSASHFNPDLLPGEAMVGDYKTIGMTRAQYRTALRLLVTTNNITIKSTNKGTIVSLSGRRVFDTNQTTIKKANETATKQEGIKQEGTNKPPNPQRGNAELREIFQKAHDKFPGTKREAGTDLHTFTKHKDWKEVIDRLLPAIDKQIAHRKKLKDDQAAFIAEWPNFQTWLNQRRWEDQYSTGSESQPPKGVDES